MLLSRAVKESFRGLEGSLGLVLVARCLEKTTSYTSSETAVKARAGGGAGTVRSIRQVDSK